MSAASSTSPASDSRKHRALAEPFDVHRPARREVDDALIALERAGGSTQRVSASPSGRTSGVRSGHGHTVGNDHGSVPSGRRPRTGPTTSGMTSPALRTMTVSPGRTSFGADLVLVVQRGHADGRAADEHRLEHGEGRGPAGAPDRHLDVAQHGGALLGRELVGDGPARRLGGDAEQLALGQLVDLHHHAVDLVVEVVAVLLPVAGSSPYTSSSDSTLADLGVDREAELARGSRASRGGS